MGSRSQRALAMLPWLVASVPFAWIAWRGFPAGDDWPFELARIAAYAHALADGQLPPFWAHSLYGGYGSPIFLFYGHVVVACACALAVLTASYAVALLLVMACASALAVRSVQLAAGSLLPAEAERGAGRVAVSLFLLNPYVLTDLLVRNACAEYAALCVMPLALHGLWRCESGQRRDASWLALGLALTVATHVLSTLLLCGVLAVLAVAPERATAGRARRLALGVGLALLGSAFAWLPAVSYQPLIRTGELLTGKFDFTTQFAAPSTLFDGSTPYSAGPLPLLCFAAAAYVWWSRRGRRLAALGLCFVGLALLQLRASVPLWRLVPPLAYLQFPWRLMGPLALVAALLGAVAFEHFTRGAPPRRRAWLELAIAALCALGALPQLARMRALPFPQVAQFEGGLSLTEMRKHGVTATVRDEYLLAAARFDHVRRPAHLEPIPSATEGARIALRADAPRAITLGVEVARASEVCVARWAFPFWKLEVDGRARPIAVCADGLLGARVPSGRHRVDLTMPPPPARTWGLALSGLGILAAALLALTGGTRNSPLSGRE